MKEKKQITDPNINCPANMTCCVPVASAAVYGPHRRSTMQGCTTIVEHEGERQPARMERLRHKCEGY